MAGQVICIAQQKGGSGKTTVAVNLAIGLRAMGKRVALVDLDPQGSLGRWFMSRVEADPARCEGLDFATSSAWGVSYECRKLADANDYVLIDTPPKADSDLRPALRAADLVVVPVAVSHMDLWATEAVLDLAAREGKPTRIVLNRGKAGTRLSAEIAAAAQTLGSDVLDAALANRVAFAEAMGRGLGAGELAKGPAREEVARLTEAVAQALEPR